MAVKGVDKVIKNIKEIYKRKIAATYGLCLKYADMAIKYFKQEQSGNRFWTNRLGIAKDTMFTDAEVTNTYIAWSMHHFVQYGVYLELANDGKHEAIRPVIMHFLPQFKKDVEKIWGHAA